MIAVAHSEPWWLATRATGFAAVVALVAVALLGVALAHRGESSGPRRVWPHRQLTWVAVSLLGLHIVSALLDRAHVPVYAVVAPFTSHVRRVPAGMGSIATWGLAVVVASVHGRRWLKSTWRRLHYLAYLATCAAVVHSLLGTDRVAMRTAITVTVLSGLLLVRPTAVAAGRRRVQRLSLGGAPRTVMPATSRQALFGVLGNPSLGDWSYRHPRIGPLTYGVAVGSAVFIFTSPFAFVGMLWVSASVALVAGTLGASSANRWCSRAVRDEAPELAGALGGSAPRRGQANRLQPAPAGGWLLPQTKVGAAPEVRCRNCAAAQSVWAGFCSQCGGDLGDAIPLGRETGAPAGRFLARAAHHQPEHLLRPTPAARVGLRLPVGPGLRGERERATRSDEMAQIG